MMAGGGGMTRRILTAALIMALAAGLGCEGTRGGTQVNNAQPTVTLANIPIDGSRWSINPTVYWFGTDSDGHIASYEYAVIAVDTMLTFDESGSYPLEDSTFYAGYSVPDEAWNVLDEEVTSTDVLMAAPSDSALYQPSYFILRAVDNGGLFSGQVGRMFFRKNNVPVTEIVRITDNWRIVDASDDSVWFCIAETTETWAGITIEWEGSDPYDVVSGEPMLDYRYMLTNEATGDTVFTTLTVTNGDSEYVGYEELTIGVDWSGLASGTYTFTVWSRDDALVEDTSGAEVTFQIVSPTFANDVLIVDNILSTGNLGNAGLGNAVAEYSTYLTNLGFSFYVFDVAGSPPPDTLLGQCTVAWLITPDRPSGPTTSMYEALSAYLEVGGGLFLSGRFTFVNYGTIGDFTEYLPDALPSRCFDLSGGYNEYWNPMDTAAGRTEQFIGGKAIGSGFVDFTLDSQKVEDAYVQLGVLPPGFNVPVYGILPEVGYYTWDAGLNASTVYTFVAADTLAALHGYPVGVTYDGPTYRAVLFDFPIYFVDNTGGTAQAIVSAALTWLLG
jgi:hypothetical protein